MAAIQPLHGLTFALLHLANTRVFAETVPPRLSATALTLYSTVGVGAAVALLTLVSGSLYAKFGAQGFWPRCAPLRCPWLIRCRRNAKQSGGGYSDISRGLLGRGPNGTYRE